MKAFLISVTLVGTAIGANFASAQDRAPDETPAAQSVEMKGSDGSDHGTVSLIPTPHGMLMEAQMVGLSGGAHAFHIHEKGVCQADFSSASGHYNPTDKDHGYLSDNGPHAGDMPNFTVADSGNANFAAFNPNVSLTEGEGPLDDDDGSALIVHSGPDDYVSQPSGSAGDRIACGVIYPPNS